MTLRPSPFAHRYDMADGTRAIFHALSLDIVFVGPEVAALFPPVWDRPLAFRVPRGGIGDVRPDYPTPDALSAPAEWIAAAENPTQEAEREAAVSLFTELHLLQEPGETFDSEWVGKLQGMVMDVQMKMLTLTPTTLCNYRCTYCHETEESRATDERMTLENAQAVIKAWGKYAACSPGKKDLLIYGGEPLLNPEVTRYAIEHFSAAPEEQYGGKVCPILVTNASRITPEWASFLKEHDVFVIVSCDAVGERNDRARVTVGGGGTFNMIERGYRMLQAAGVRTAISVTVGTHNAIDIHDSFVETIDYFKPLDIGLNSCLHQEHGDAENPIAAEPLAATQRMLEAYSRARAKGVYVEQFNRRIRPLAMRNHRVKDCSSCGGRIVAHPNGRFSFCDGFSYTDEYSYTFEGELDLENNKDYERWSKLSPLNWPDCYECPALALCGGGCRYDAAMASGRIDGLDPHRCTQDREILRWAVNDLGRIVEAQALTGSQVLLPSEAARKQLLGELTLDPLTIPLGNANRYGERVGRPVEQFATSRD